jgi:hypothetical protein
MTKPQFRVGGAGKGKSTIGATPHGASATMKAAAGDRDRHTHFHLTHLQLTGFVLSTRFNLPFEGLKH